MSFLHRQRDVRSVAQTEDIIDIEVSSGEECGDACYMPRVDLACEKGHHISILLLTSNPRLIILFGERGEADDHLQFGATEEHLFDHVAALGSILYADEDTEVELVMEVRLTDILHESAVFAEHFRNCRSDTRFIKTDDVD